MEFSATKNHHWFKVTIVKSLLSLFLLLESTPLWAMNQLVDIKYHSAIKHQIEMELIFKHSIKKPKVAIKEGSTQLQLNFANSASSLEKKTVPINLYGVNSVSTEQVGDILQVQVDMASVKPYQGRVDGNSYLLTINDAISIDKSQNRSFINGVKQIDFRRNGDNSGKLIISLDNPSIAADVERLGTKLELKLYNTEIQNDMLYVMDVQDFATPVKNVETFQEDLITRVLIDINGDYEFQHEQQNNVFILDINQVKSKTTKEESKNYDGKSLSLNFQSIPVRTVLQIIADYNDFNLVTSDTVEGDITLRLDDVPWDQALDLILQTKGLDKRIQGNILMVAPAAEIAVRENQVLKNQQEVKNLSPLYSEYLQINYAKANEIAELLKSSDSSLLSTRGTVAVDERTNTLLVKDTSETLVNLSRLIKVLDVPIKQVLIESRMVTVKDGVSEDIGIRWGISGTRDNVTTGGSLEGIGGSDNLNDGLNLNLPAPAGSASIAFQIAKFAGDAVLDLELSALESENKGEIIASPRITTSNQKAAYIEQGVEIPYLEASSSGATSVSFKKAVLSLRVTPQITPDDRVILDLEITQDSQGRTVDTSTGQAVSIDTQRIGTQVLVDNGETVVLGGIYQQNKISRVSKVPILGDIPYLGFFFRSTSDINERQELLIFVTPKIVSEDI